MHDALADVDNRRYFMLKEPPIGEIPIMLDGVRIGSWLVAGKAIELRLDVPVTLKTESDVTIESGGNLVTASKGDTVAIAGGMHHTQPSGTAYYDLVMAGSVGEEWRELMEARAQQYSKQDEASRRRQFYAMAARRAMKHRKKKHGGSSCGCK